MTPLQLTRPKIGPDPFKSVACQNYASLQRIPFLLKRQSIYILEHRKSNPRAQHTLNLKSISNRHIYIKSSYLY